MSQSYGPLLYEAQPSYTTILYFRGESEEKREKMQIVNFLQFHFTSALCQPIILAQQLGLGEILSHRPVIRNGEDAGKNFSWP